MALSRWLGYRAHWEHWCVLRTRRGSFPISCGGRTELATLTTAIMDRRRPPAPSSYRIKKSKPSGVEALLNACPNQVTEFGRIPLGRLQEFHSRYSRSQEGRFDCWSAKKGGHSGPVDSHIGAQGRPEDSGRNGPMPLAPGERQTASFFGAGW